jgi:hypothetical protein
MKFYGKADEVAARIVEAFKAGTVPAALAQAYISGCKDNHAKGYSLFNRFIVAINGYTDANGFQGWKNEGRNVKKGEKAFYILAPITSKIEADGEKRYIVCGFKGVPVFGIEQTEGKELPKVAEDVAQYIDALPLIDVAKAWGLTVDAENGKDGAALGCYTFGKGITLAVKNLSTWAHELMHAADDKLGTIGKKHGDYAFNEVVAEMGGAVLLTMLGKANEADTGGAYEYITHWAAKVDKNAADACVAVLTRVCKVVDFIMQTANGGAEVEEGESE